MAANGHRPGGSGRHDHPPPAPRAEVAFLCGETPTPGQPDQPPQPDAVLVGGLRHGRLSITAPTHASSLIEPGTLFFSEYRQRIDRHWIPRNFLFLVLPRSLATHALGHDIDLAQQAVYPIPHQGLAPLLWAQLDMLARHGGGLAPQEWQPALSAAAELALALLRQRFGATDHAAGPRSPDALCDAARLYIGRHYTRPDLTAGAIAAAIGCSRTQLYRVFGAAGLTVGGYLRDLRLNQARHALEQGTASGLGALAFQCGYSDLSAFGKAFRRRFGIAPSAWPDRPAETPLRAL